MNSTATADGCTCIWVSTWNIDTDGVDAVDRINDPRCRHHGEEIVYMSAPASVIVSGLLGGLIGLVGGFLAVYLLQVLS